MQSSPRHRWFRFRLSTVLILTAIAAATMALKPRLTCGHLGDPYPDFGYRMISFHVSLDQIPMNYEVELDSVCCEFLLTRPTRQDHWWVAVGPKAFFYPALALAAFVAWKAAWALVERRRRMSTTAE